MSRRHRDMNYNEYNEEYQEEFDEDNNEEYQDLPRGQKQSSFQTQRRGRGGGSDRKKYTAYEERGEGEYDDEEHEHEHEHEQEQEQEQEQWSHNPKKPSSQSQQFFTGRVPIPNDPYSSYSSTKPSRSNRGKRASQITAKDNDDDDGNFDNNEMRGQGKRKRRIKVRDNKETERSRNRRKSAGNAPAMEPLAKTTEAAGGGQRNNRKKERRSLRNDRNARRGNSDFENQQQQSQRQRGSKVWKPRQKSDNLSNSAVTNHGYRFEDRVVCVTGVGKGIGKDLFLQLIREGAYVIGVTRTEKDFEPLEQQIQQWQQQQQPQQPQQPQKPQEKEEENKETNTTTTTATTTAENLLANGGAETETKNELLEENLKEKKRIPQYRLICGDVSVKSDLDYIIESCIESKVEMLVNNAGVALTGKFLDVKYEDLRTVHETNFEAVFLLSQGIARYWVENGIKGRIVNISSSASLRVLDEHTSYCTSKFALDGLTKCMALELGRYNIRVNSVHPTVVLTPMGISVWQNNPDKAKPLLARIPMQRFVETREVVQTVLFLLSDDASMVHGALVPIDGGLTI